MKNFVQEGTAINVTAPTGGMQAGKGYLFGQLFGVSPVDANAGETVALWTRGVFVMAKASGAWTVGQPLYWDNGAGAKNVTGTATGNTKIGVATKAAASGDTTGEVRLNGFAMTSTF